MPRRKPDQYLSHVLRGWIARTARKHYWRVAAWMDFEDLVQEGMLAYAIVRSRYEVENAKHFQALTQIVFLNQIHKLAKKKAHTVDQPFADLVDERFGEGFQLEELAGFEDGNQELSAALTKAAPEVKRLLALLGSQEGLDALLAPPHGSLPDGRRETAPARLKRLCGADPAALEAGLRQALGVA